MKLKNFDIEKTTTLIETCFPLPSKTSAKVNERSNSALIYVVRGGIRFNFNKSEFIARERDVVYLPENCSYIYKASKEISAIQIDFNIIDREKKANLLFSEHPILALIDTGEEIQESFSLILKSFASPSLSAKIKRTGEFFKILSIIEDSEINDDSIMRLAPALYRLREGYCEKVYIKELSDLCGMSQATLRRLFKETFGMSPITYKNNLRIKMACSLIVSGAYGISEISEILGFEDIYAFSHAFKKATGVTPSKYKDIGNKDNKYN